MPRYDLGFLKQGDTYDLVADWYGITDIQPESFLQQVQQKYAYHAVKERMTEQGFETFEEVSKYDGLVKTPKRPVVASLAY